jgi:phage baseplate assembly protein W
MLIPPKQTIYSDIPLSFLAHPINGNIKPLTNEDAIKQSVKNIVLTSFFERPYAPLFGGNIYDRLFDNVESSYTQFLITEDLTDTIVNYEPRAKLVNIDVNPDADRNTLNITIKFIPITSTEIVTVDVIIERVR